MLRPPPTRSSGSFRRAFALGWTATLLIGWVGEDAAWGQEVNGPPGVGASSPTLNGFEPRLPLPPPPFRADPSGSTAAIEIKVGQGRFLTLKEDLTALGGPAPFVAVGDPSVADFFQVGPRQLRLLGKRLGTTDLTLTTGTGKTYDFEVQVVADLDVLRAQLRQIFPDASLQVAQLREKLIVEGQARDASQVVRIVATIESYIRAVQRVQVTGQVGDAQNQVTGEDPNTPPGPPQPPGAGANPVAASAPPMGIGSGTTGFGPATGIPVGASAATTSPGAFTAGQIAANQLQVINLIRVPTSQQVLLKVRIAELNRTAFRQIGADFVASFASSRNLFGTQIAGNGFTPGRVGYSNFPYTNGGTLTSDLRGLNLGSQATAFATFNDGQLAPVLNALRRNNVLKVLAEPNLVALNGHQASFLAGGEFPVPSFSGVGSGSGVGGTSSTQFKKFGVQLSFIPIVQDNEVIRLTVDPEVSSIDYSIATTLVPGGSPVPGLNVRNAHTTVELRQGDTLAIAGLLQLELDGNTQRLPGLGDLPYIGAFFSNTTSNRVEKELVVLVTPYVVEPIPPGQVPPTPGDEVNQPNDLEFFFQNRIEGRTGVDSRATTMYDDPLRLIRNVSVERKYLVGPGGYSH